MGLIKALKHCSDIEIFWLDKTHRHRRHIKLNGLLGVHSHSGCNKYVYASRLSSPNPAQCCLAIGFRHMCSSIYIVNAVIYIQIQIQIKIQIQIQIYMYMHV